MHPVPGCLRALHDPILRILHPARQRRWPRPPHDPMIQAGRERETACFRVAKAMMDIIARDMPPGHPTAAGHAHDRPAWIPFPDQARGPSIGDDLPDADIDEGALVRLLIVEVGKQPNHPAEIQEAMGSMKRVLENRLKSPEVPMHPARRS